MPVAAWPVGISFIAHPDTYQESGPIGNVLRTPMEKGPVKSRRRFTSAVRHVSGQTDIMTEAQVETFIDWHRDTIAGGALRFTAVNPRTGQTGTYRFIDKYDIIHLNDDKERISMKLEQFP